MHYTQHDDGQSRTIRRCRRSGRTVAYIEATCVCLAIAARAANACRWRHTRCRRPSSRRRRPLWWADRRSRAAGADPRQSPACCSRNRDGIYRHGTGSSARSGRAVSRPPQMDDDRRRAARSRDGHTAIMMLATRREAIAGARCRVRDEHDRMLLAQPGVIPNEVGPSQAPTKVPRFARDVSGFGGLLAASSSALAANGIDVKRERMRCGIVPSGREQVGRNHRLPRSSSCWR